jgi:peptidoglycan hydrolase-like protein with peptidoglycan-binding domain
VSGTLFGRNIGSIPQPTVDAYKALEQALRFSGYQPDSAWSYNCRKIAGSSKDSLHSFGIAIDIDPALNPYSAGDPYSGAIKRHHVEAVLAVKNPQGERVWSWGGHWRKPDRMHFQIDQGPDRVAVDWLTVPGAGEHGKAGLAKGSKGQAVAHFQKCLMIWNSEALPEFGADGDFGSETSRWVGEFQKNYSLPVTGSLDGVTASLLIGVSTSKAEG